jgi:DGQHR domain-containing protein
MNNYIELNYIKLTQPIGEFYVSSIKWEELIDISKADIRKIHQEGENKDSFDSYLGIQRKVSASRIKEISDYVRTVDATFPTSIILHINSEDRTIDGKKVENLDPEFVEKNLDNISIIKNIFIDQSKNKLYIRKDDKVARILDGQHRIEGLRYSSCNNDLFNEKLNNFDLNITIFVDLDLDDQAQIFSVINKAQTKVNKSLVYDLFEYAKHRSPQKTSHDIVRLLNKEQSSPFYRKVKILGTAEDKESETLAQATFVELIMSYITNNPMKDRDLLKKSNFFNKNPLSKLINQKDIEKYIFRNLFIDEKDEIIYINIFNYFEVIRSKWPNSWSVNTEGNILNKSTGLIALMKLLRHIVIKIGIYDDQIPKHNFEKVFDLINIADESFTKNIYVPGSSGQSKLFHTLKSFIS